MSNSDKPYKTRTELKRYFKNGTMPDETRFADMIDSLLHHDDLPALTRQAIELPQPAPRPAPQPSPSPSTMAWVRGGGRLGTYDGKQGPQQLASPTGLVKSGVAADGKPHAVLTGLNDCFGFEIVACASGLVASNKQAITHAIVLLSFEGSASGIRQTASYKGWDCRRKICFKWVRNGSQYDLTVRTGVNFGKDEQGRQVQIQYHITRLW